MVKENTYFVDYETLPNGDVFHISTYNVEEDEIVK